MIMLEDGMYLYHGSYTPVEVIDLDKCMPHKDFGKGFYVTSSIEQARDFVHLSLSRARARRMVPRDTRIGHVSTYKLKNADDLQIEYFRHADRRWLHFVVGNRDGEYFAELIERYARHDVIVGKIANDRTATTLQAYMENVYGEIGTVSADERAIATLLPNKLENQICFRTWKAVARLEFVGSESYEQ